ncbi:unnamed protein product [Prorocentrum cordatum]|uniref:Uncharacterized protein n=1 Tax=Prorocentrum cordatum TaxID=2364126 RepID=A0ABN9WZV4_9DINO|nr:unnamed protein product [Polarella glacialis]
MIGPPPVEQTLETRPVVDQLAGLDADMLVPVLVEQDLQPLHVRLDRRVQPARHRAPFEAVGLWALLGPSFVTISSSSSPAPSQPARIAVSSFAAGHVQAFLAMLLASGARQLAPAPDAAMAQFLLFASVIQFSVGSVTSATPYDMDGTLENRFSGSGRRGGGIDNEDEGSRGGGKDEQPSACSCWRTRIRSASKRHACICMTRTPRAFSRWSWEDWTHESSSEGK